MSVSPPRVLVVDDDDALRAGLEQALQLRFDHVIVDTCGRAQEALRQVESYRYDVVIADYRMPGMDGRAFLAHVNRVRPRTPGILISGHVGAVPPDPQGTFVFVPKPVDRDQFFETVRRAIELSHRVRRAAERSRQLQQRAAELREAYRRLLAEHRDRSRTPGAGAMVTIEPDGTIVRWDHGAESLYGWRRAEVLGRDLLAVTSAALPFEEVAAIRAALRAGDPWRGRLSVRDRNGTRFLADIVDAPLMDPTHGLVGVVELAARAR